MIQITETSSPALRLHLLTLLAPHAGVAVVEIAAQAESYILGQSIVLPPLSPPTAAPARAPIPARAPVDETEAVVRHMLAAGERVTGMALAERMHYSGFTGSKRLADLVTRGILRREGSTTTTRYVLVEDAPIPIPVAPPALGDQSPAEIPPLPCVPTARLVATVPPPAPPPAVAPPPPQSEVERMIADHIATKGVTTAPADYGLDQPAVDALRASCNDVVKSSDRKKPWMINGQGVPTEILWRRANADLKSRRQPTIKRGG